MILTDSPAPSLTFDEPRLAPRALGAHASGQGTRFTVYGTTAQQYQVRVYAEPGKPIGTHPLSPVGAGIHETVLHDVGPGALYQFVVDGRELPDPYARFLPFGVHGPAMVMQSAYRWRHVPCVARPMHEHVIYELHVGTFSESGTYDGVRAKLPYLAELGITALELMPLAAFPGRRGWGYDGVALFAPFAGYGTPEQLRALVDEAHGHGLAVFLDVVYNHFGPAGNYLASYSSDYFTGAIRNAWGDSPNYAAPAMRRLVLDNARYWLTEFRFDGLRLDAIHAITDPSPVPILRELADEVARLEPPKLLIAEDERNDPSCVTALGMNAVWADDFHHHLRVTLTGEQDGYYAAYRPDAGGIAEAIRGGWSYVGQWYAPTSKLRGRPAPHLPAEAFVYCIQNHDQVGNRAFGDRLAHVVSAPAYAAASTLLLFLPMTPLLFMGQEWAASTPFLFFTDHDEELGRLVSEGRRREFAGFLAFGDGADVVPDPQAAETFLRSRLRWDEQATGDHARVLALYRELLTLRRSDPVLRAAGRASLEAAADGSVLRVRRWTEDDERLLVVNLGAAAVKSTDVAGRPVIFRSGEARGHFWEPYEAVVYGARRAA